MIRPCEPRTFSRNRSSINGELGRDIGAFKSLRRRRRQPLARIGAPQRVDAAMTVKATGRRRNPAKTKPLEALLMMKKVRPEILMEFTDKVSLLQKEKPLNEPVQGVVQQILKSC